MKNKIIEKLSSIDTFNIKVVGGLEQPIIPEEGLIWVKTQSITFNYILSSTQPKDNNLIWIELDATGVPLKINQSGTLAVGLKACQFYKDNIWNNVDAWVYTGGKWVQFSFEIIKIYNAGQEEVEITGGLTIDGYSFLGLSGSLIGVVIAQKQANAIFFSGDQAVVKFVGTMNPIKFDKYKNLKIVWAASNYNSNYGRDDILRVTVSRDKKLYNNKSNALAVQSIDYTDGSKITTNLDVTAISGDAYISVVCPWSTAPYSGYLFQLELS